MLFFLKQERFRFYSIMLFWGFYENNLHAILSLLFVGLTSFIKSTNCLKGNIYYLERKKRALATMKNDLFILQTSFLTVIQLV